MVTDPRRPSGGTVGSHGVTGGLDAWALDGGSLVITLVLAVMVAFGVTGILRVFLALGFAAYVPGRAVVANWPSARARSEIALPVVLSISMTTLASVLGLWLHAWQPLTQFAVEATASVLALTVALLPRVRAKWVPPFARANDRR